MSEWYGFVDRRGKADAPQSHDFVPKGAKPGSWVRVPDPWLPPTEATEGAALRDNKGKPSMHYILTMPNTVTALTAVLDQGEEKYAYLNHMKGGKPDREYWDAGMRHLLKAARYILSHNTDDLYDEESGCLHVAHAIWNFSMLIELNWKSLPVKKED